jgi:hypothetical protein
MCAEINSIKPAGAKYKPLVPPAKTPVRVAVANSTCQAVTPNMKLENAIVQAVMRKREGSRAPLNYTFRDGRAFITCAQGNTEVLLLQMRPKHHRGPRPQACTKGSIRELGSALESRRRNLEVGRQGLMTKSKTNLSREIRCLHSSQEVR